MAATKYKHTNAANRYATAVAKGRLPACKWVVKSCQRHIDDQARDDFPYRFDKAEAERAIAFIHNLPHVKGRWAAERRLIELSDWQKFVVASIFGWRRKSDGRRRFREAFLLVPRKNGKSVLASAIGLYMFAADREYGAEVYSGATTEKQSWEVFRPARMMALRTPALCEHFGIDINAKALVKPDDGSRFEPVIGNPGDGSSPSLAIVDEFHEHDSPALYDTMITGMGARDQPLMLVISTAGSNTAGPCYEMQMDVQKVLDGVFENDRLFGLIYTLDEGDDWRTEYAMRKANPNYDISVSGDYLKVQIQQAIQSPSKQNVIKTKHYNIWVGAREAWVNMEQWRRCADATMVQEDFADCPSIVAIDLASRVDMAAVVQVFFRYIEGKLHYYVFPRFYLPESAVEGSKNAQRYAGWAHQGLLEVMAGDEVVFNDIQSDIIDLTRRYDVREVVYDPWQATQLAQNLVADGATAVEFRNTVQLMSPAMREMEGAIASGRLHHPDNPILTWMASNVTAKADAKENIFPRKEQPEQKIDGIVACIMGIGRAFYAEEHHPYDERGFIAL